MKVWWVALALGLLLSARSVGAQTVSDSDRAVRVNLMLRAEEARLGGNFDEALRLVQQAERIGATAGTRMFLARLHMQRGRSVDAWLSAEQCIQEVDLDAQTTQANRTALRLACTSIQREASARVAWLTVQVPMDAPQGFVVRLGGQVLPAALYGVPRPVEAGLVEVTSSSPGRPSWQHTERLNPGVRATVTVEVLSPPTAPRGVAARAPSEALQSSQTARRLATPVTEAEAPRGATQRTLAWVSGITGLALVAGAAGASLAFQSTASDYDRDGCARALTPPQSCHDRYSSLETLNTLQWVGYIGGGGLATLGIVLLVTAPSSHSVATPVSVSVGSGGAVGMNYTGRF